MTVQNDNTILNKGDLKAYHEAIAPMLGGTLLSRTNVSDHYSTDEKIVGVWTDGRPLYQKTWTGTVSFTAGTEKVLIDSLPANLDGDNSWVDDSASFICTYPGITDSGTRQSGFVYNNKSSLQMWLGSSSVIRIMASGMPNGTNIPFVCTLKYTKTTDTAGSGVTTPGAYDINFPNTWKENTEIYFGNGLYGKRISGTGVSDGKTIDNIANVSKICSMGGQIQVASNTNTHALPYVTNAPNYWGASVYRNGSTGDIRLAVGSSYTSSDTYDIWITYTK